ncbi:MAG TPA: ATP-binding protein, partial [Vicinamibacteria bacterium]
RRVVLAFTMHPREIEVEVRDEGKGFDPDSIPDPVAEENLLKTYGRGIFFMRSFMDTLHYSFPPEGGTVVRMTKRVAAAESVTEG